MAYSAGGTFPQAPKLNTGKLAKLPGVTKLPTVIGKPVRDAFPSEVKMQNRRIGGLTRGLLQPYQETPGRYLPKARGLKPGGSLKTMANASKPKVNIV